MNVHHTSVVVQNKSGHIVLYVLALCLSVILGSVPSAAMAAQPDLTAAQFESNAQSAGMDVTSLEGDYCDGGMSLLYNISSASRLSVESCVLATKGVQTAIYLGLSGSFNGNPTSQLYDYFDSMGSTSTLMSGSACVDVTEYNDWVGYYFAGSSVAIVIDENKDADAGRDLADQLGYDGHAAANIAGGLVRVLRIVGIVILVAIFALIVFLVMRFNKKKSVPAVGYAGAPGMYPQNGMPAYNAYNVPQPNSMPAQGYQQGYPAQQAYQQGYPAQQAYQQPYTQYSQNVSGTQFQGVPQQGYPTQGGYQQSADQQSYQANPYQQGNGTWGQSQQ